MTIPQPPPFQGGAGKTGDVIGQVDRADFQLATKEIVRLLEASCRIANAAREENRESQEQMLRLLVKIKWNTFWVALVVFIIPLIMFIFWMLVGIAVVSRAG